jgi:hypothetical protein
MSDKDQGEKSIKVIYFSGKSAGLRVWNHKFMARANRIGYKKILEGKTAIPMQHDYKTAEAKDPKDRTDDDKKTIENYRFNEKAYEDLLLSIKGEKKLAKLPLTLLIMLLHWIILKVIVRLHGIVSSKNMHQRLLPLTSSSKRS